MALTAKMKRFAEEYIIDLNATQAAIRAGYSAQTAGSVGHENLKKPEIAEYIDQLLEERSLRTRITADRVLERWWEIANADPNELALLRRLNCRHCHGTNHKFQWVSEEEYEKAYNNAIAEARALSVEKGEEIEPNIPSNEGGYGFDKMSDPHPDCPKCHGEGILDLHLADTRKISVPARRLFAGIKQTQAGIEIKFRDQDKALENIARHLGMFKEKVELTGDEGGPLQVVFSSKIRKRETETE